MAPKTDVHGIIRKQEAAAVYYLYGDDHNIILALCGRNPFPPHAFYQYERRGINDLVTELSGNKPIAIPASESSRLARYISDEAQHSC